jgi:hypothetical protein
LFRADLWSEPHLVEIRAFEQLLKSRG